MSSGIIVIDKPAGMTSHQVVGRLRRVLGTRKIGHAGTLDPMATGVLIMGVNKATRLLGHLAFHDKQYLARIRLGEARSTDDAEGDLVSATDASAISRDAIEAGVSALTGDILQVPSSVSAIKVNGERAYARVRRGEEIELDARPVTVDRFDVEGISWHDGLCDVSAIVDCSSGTYVRALARDLGTSLGVGGHLTSLRRTRIGRYTLENAYPLDEVSAETPLMAMADAARLSFSVCELSADEAIDVGYGRALSRQLPSSPTGLVCEGRLLGLYTAEGKPIAVFPPD